MTNNEHGRAIVGHSINRSREILASPVQKVHAEALEGGRTRLPDAPVVKCQSLIPTGAGEAVAFAGAQVTASLDHHLQVGATDGISGFLAMWRSILLQSDFHIGCPVLAVAVEEPIDEAAVNARKATTEAFSQWEERLTTALVTQGHDPAAASGPCHTCRRCY